MRKCILLIFLFSLFLSCKKKTKDNSSVIKGGELARISCQSCHLFPSPELLDKRTWEKFVLPKMGYRMGIYPDSSYPKVLYETGEGGQRVQQASIYPDRPTISNEDWLLIKEYYLKNAPEKLEVNEKNVKIEKGLSLFNVITPSYKKAPALTTAVKIYPPTKQIFFADTKPSLGSTISVLNNKGDLQYEFSLDTSVPSHINVTDAGFSITSMGSFSPTDNSSGKILNYFGERDGRYVYFKRQLENLQRPVYTEYADLTNDGIEDILVSEFGNLTGSLSLYVGKNENEYEKLILKNLSGCIKTYIVDIDNNGFKDIIALFSQGDESISVFFNNGEGNFKEERWLSFPPSYGSNSFEINDYNNDGHLDILVTNGDNADYDPILKPYHGIRIYLNNGSNSFKEAFFFPINGVYKTITADYDLDGDLDIATVSFFPDYKDKPEESFVYLENITDINTMSPDLKRNKHFEFKPLTFENNDRGRWITFDAGDIDKDGDIDIVLGSFSAMEIVGDDRKLSKKWIQSGPSVLILENQSR